LIVDIVLVVAITFGLALSLSASTWRIGRTRCVPAGWGHREKVRRGELDS
jgi:hypothetical protein